MISHIPFNALQAAVYTLLHDGQTIPVYDAVPSGTDSMPYIVLGEFHGTPVVENKTTMYHAVNQQIHVWSKQHGKKEINSIMDDIVFLLTSYKLDLQGYAQVSEATISLYQAWQELYEDKTRAYHGMLQVELIVQQNLD